MSMKVSESSAFTGLDSLHMMMVQSILFTLTLRIIPQLYHFSWITLEMRNPGR